MANEVKIVLTGDSGQVNGMLQKVVGSTADATEKIKRSWLGTSAAIAGAMITANKAMDYLTLGAKAQQAEESFHRVATAYKEDANKIIADMKRVSAGAVDDSDIMQKAVKGMVQGLSGGQLVKVMEASRVAARLTGEDVKVAYENITDAIANNLPKALIRYGLVTKDQMKIVNAALAAGIDDVHLYDIAMANAEKQMASFGTISTTTAEELQQLHAIINSLKEGIGVGLYRAIYGVGLAFVETGKMIVAPFALIEMGLNKLGVAGTMWQDTFNEQSKIADTWRAKMMGVSETAQQTGGDVAAADKKIADMMANLKKQIGEAKAAEKIKEIELAMLSWQGKIESLNPALDDTSKEIIELWNAAEELKKKFGDKAWIGEGLMKGLTFITDRQAAEQTAQVQSILTEIVSMRATANDKELLDLDAKYYEEGVKLENNLDAQTALMEKYAIERQAILNRQGQDAFLSYISSVQDLVPAFDEATQVAEVWGETTEEYLERVVEKQAEWMPLLEDTKRELEEQGLTGSRAYNDIQNAIQGVKNNQAELNKTFGGGVQQGIDDYLKSIEFSFERGREIALDNIHAIEDAMMTAFDDPKKGLDDLFDYFKFTLKRMTVEALASKITIPIATALTGGQAGIQGALSSIVGGGNILGSLGSLAGGIGLPALAAGGIGGMLGGNTGTGAMFGGLAGSMLLTGAGTAGYGLIGGSLMSGLMGGGSGIVGGALAGSIVPIIGTLIGAAVGALAGSLFGGDQDVPRMKMLQNEKGLIIADDNYDLEGKEQVNKTLSAIREGLMDFTTSIGGDLSNFTAEWKTSWKEIENARDVDKAIKKWIGQYSEFTTGIDFSQFQKGDEELYQTVARIIDAFAAIPDLKESVDDYIDAVNGSSDAVAQWREAVIDAKADVKELEDAIDDMVDPADRIAALNDLKTATWELHTEQKNMINGMVDTIENTKIEKADFALSMAEKISGLLGTAMADISIPTDAMDTAKRRMEEAGTASGKLGYLQQYIGYLDKWVEQNLSAIEQKYATEKALLEDQVRVIEKWKSVQESVGRQISGMKLSTDNPQDVLARLGIARSEVERLGGLYTGAEGDQKAGYAPELQQSIEDYLKLAQEAYQRPSSAYRAIYDEALGWLEKIQTDASAMGTDDTDLLRRIGDIDDAMASDIKSFSESAASYYQWAKGEGAGLYEQAIAEQTAALADILGDKTVEQYLADLQKEAVDQLSGIKDSLDKIYVGFTAWQQNAGTADIGDIKDILSLGSNPFQKGTSEEAWWKDWHGKDVSIEQATAFLDDILDDIASPFKKAKKSWNAWFDQFADIPGFADGATVNSPTLAVIGERKREHVLDEDKLVQIVKEAGGGGTYNVTIEIHAGSGADAKEIAKEARREFSNFLKYDRDVPGIIKARVR